MTTETVNWPLVDHCGGASWAVWLDPQKSHIFIGSEHDCHKLAGMIRDAMPTHDDVNLIEILEDSGKPLLVRKLAQIALRLLAENTTLKRVPRDITQP